MATGEVNFLIKYGEACHEKNVPVLHGLLLALPVILAGQPSEAFVATLSTHASLRKTLETVAPDYKKNASYALIATAIEAIEARSEVTICMNQDLNSQLSN